MISRADFIFHAGGKALDVCSVFYKDKNTHHYWCHIFKKKKCKFFLASILTG